MSSDLKVMVTGGAEYLGKQLMDYFSGESLSVSRRNGYDISTPEGVKKICADSLNYDVFINCAFEGTFAQTKLLYELFDVWKAKKKKGHIFNISSIATFHRLDERKGREPQFWVPMKHSLDICAMQCCFEIQVQQLPFRLTNLRPATLDIEKMKARPDWPGVGISGSDIGKTIDFLFHQDEHLNVPDMVIQNRPL